MTNEDDTLHIIYNGEIYNHADYREWLESRGHVYKTHCDTETILHLYEEHGIDCVEHLRGMFAFAIWDKRKQELFIARDRLGVKPLYYFHADDGSLFFGSEIKTLFAAAAPKPKLNYAALPDYLAITLLPARRRSSKRETSAAGPHARLARRKDRRQTLLGREFCQSEGRRATPTRITSSSGPNCFALP